MLLKDSKKYLLGLLIENKLYINNKNSFLILDKVIDLKDTVNINNIVYNNNFLLINNNIDYEIKDNIVYVELNNRLPYKDQNILDFNFKIKINLDKTILFIKNFRNDIIVLDS